MNKNTPRIYFAGVNTSPLCEAFADHHVLETFADIRKLLDRYRPTFKSMCLDSGAYSALASGVQIDIEEFIDYCQIHKHFYDFIASLDSIDGGPEVNVANWQRMRDRGVYAIPTFHQGEPWSLLSEYTSGSSMIGLGFQRPIKDARAFLDKCFENIPTGHLVHGWGMTSYTYYPFSSVDSRTWFFEMRALMGVKGQGADALGCLTNRELIDIVIKKYMRLPIQKIWRGEEPEQENEEAA